MHNAQSHAQRARPFGFLKTQMISRNRASQCFVAMIHPIIPAARNAATTDGGMGVPPSRGKALADAWRWSATA